MHMEGDWHVAMVKKKQKSRYNIILYAHLFLST